MTKIISNQHFDQKNQLSDYYHLLFGTILVTAGLEEIGCFFGTNIRPSFGLNLVRDRLSGIVLSTVNYFRNVTVE